MRTTSRWLMPLLTLTLFFGAIGVAQAAGWWETSGRQAVAAGTMTVDDLKGWMTLQEAADGLGVPATELVALVQAPAGVVLEPETAFKDIEGLVPGFELTAYRDVVQAHLDGRSGTTAAAPATGAPAATQAATPSATPSGTPSAIVPTAPSSVTPTHVPTATPTGTPEGDIRGSMTIREVAEANDVPIDRLLDEAGLPADLDPDLALREIQNVVPGFEIQTVRDAVAALAG